MSSVRYKGFKIMAAPYQLHACKQWTVDLEIRGNGRRQPFRMDERYATQQEANARCSDLGRRIIDGRVPGCSVDHMRVDKTESMRQLVILGIVILALGAFALLGR